MGAPTSLWPATPALAAPIPSHTILLTATLAARKETQVSVPLITPYVYPPECTNIYRILINDGRTHTYAQFQETVLYVDTSSSGLSNPWRTCLPRRVGQEESSFAEGDVYKATVCPSGWMAYNVGYETRKEWVKNQNSKITKTISTAGCCMSGHEYVLDIWDLYPGRNSYPKKPAYACASGHRNRHDHPTRTITLASDLTLGVSIFTSTRSDTKWFYDYSISTYRTEIPPTIVEHTYTVTKGSEVTVTNTIAFLGRAFYPAMSMEWEESDNPSLDPPWPTLTSDMLIPSWTPGMKLGSIYENKGAGHDYEADRPKPATIKMKIVIPIIATLGGIILLAILYIMYRRISRRFAERRERREKLATAEYASGTALGLEMSDMGSSTSLHDSSPVATENVVPVEGEDSSGAGVRKKGTRIGRWWRRNTTGEGVVPRVDARVRELPLRGSSEGAAGSAV